MHGCGKIYIRGINRKQKQGVRERTAHTTKTRFGKTRFPHVDTNVSQVRTKLHTRHEDAASPIQRGGCALCVSSVIHSLICFGAILGVRQARKHVRRMIQEQTAPLGAPRTPTRTPRPTTRATTPTTHTDHPDATLPRLTCGAPNPAPRRRQGLGIR